MLSFFRKPVKANIKKESSTDEIRKFAKSTYITPARQRGDKTVTFTASDIQNGMQEKELFSAICGAIDAKKFCEFARVKLLKRSGTKQGATAKWTFGI